MEISLLGLLLYMRNYTPCYTDYQQNNMILALYCTASNELWGDFYH